MTTRTPRTQEMDAIVARIEDFRRAKGLSKNAFAIDCGIDKNTYSNCFGKQRSKPSTALLLGVIGAGANPRWLMTGEGQMFNIVNPDTCQMCAGSGQCPHCQGRGHTAKFTRKRA